MNSTTLVRPAVKIIWDHEDDALAYEVYVTEASGRETSIVRVDDASLSLSGEAATYAVFKLTPEGQSGIAFRSQPAEADDSTIDLESFASYDIERRPIVRFKVAAESEIVMLGGNFTLEWEPIRRRSARAVHVRVYNAAEEKTIADAIVSDADSYEIDLSGQAGATIQTFVRILFDDRWGKFVNGPRLRCPDSGGLALAQDESKRMVAGRDAFYASPPTTPRANLELLLDDIAQRRTILSSYPSFICLMFGYNCNLNCLMCDEGRVRRPHHIPRSLVDDVLENFLPVLTDLELVGGEPLLYPEAEEIAGRAEEHPELRIRLSTNATLLNERWRERIVNGTYRLFISMDGATKSTYEAVRRKANFDGITQNIRSLNDQLLRAGKRFDASINYVIMKQNWHELTQMVRLTADLGIPALHFNLVEYPGGEEWIEVLDAVTSRDAAKKLLDELRTAVALGRELGVEVDTRAIPRIVNMFPSLVETREEAWMLPYRLTDPEAPDARPDLLRKEEISEKEMERLQELRGTTPPPELAMEHRTLESVDEELEHRHAAAVAFLRRRMSGALCDYPFSVLNLDTYRTFVCCFSQPKYLYGHRYDIEQPTVFDVWNSPFMQRARAAMYEERFDEVCHTRCPFYRGGGTYENLNRALHAAHRSTA